MSLKKNPVRSTIFAGLIFSLLYAPISLLLQPYFGGFWPMKITLVLFLIIYSLLMARWAEVKITKIIFPMLILILTINFNPVYELKYFVICLALTLSWIRSITCYYGFSLNILIFDFLLSLSGAILSLYFSPHTLAGVCLSIWMFFLIQSLYFLAIGKRNISKHITIIDPFAASQRELEKLLKGIGP